MKTKAVVFTQADRYEVQDITLDELEPNDIRVRTLVTAISPGTERWTLRGKHIGTRFPCVPGYHRIGIVEERGSEVCEFEVGDIVYGCGNRWKETHIHPMWGAHVGCSVGPASSYWFLASVNPGPFELETTVFTMLVAVANRGMRFLEVQPHQKVLIIGGGIIGLCAAQLAGLRRAPAMLLEKDPDRIGLAGRLALPAVSPDDEDLDQKLSDFAPDGFDILYDTAGHAPTTDAMVQKMKQRSRLLLQAQYFDKEHCAIDLDQIKIHEMTVVTTCGTDAQDLFETVTNIQTRRLNIAALITHRFKGPGDLLKGYELLDRGKPLNLGIVFKWE